MRNSLSQSLRQYPLSHGLRRAGSPKGAPFGNAGKFAITAQSRPLGEGGCERSEQTEGVHSGESLTGKTRLRGFSHVHTSFTSLLLSVLCCLWYTMVNMGHHGNIETDRM